MNDSANGGGRKSATLRLLDGLIRLLIVSSVFVCPIFFLPGTEDRFRPSKELLVNWVGLTLLFLELTRWLAASPQLVPIPSAHGLPDRVRRNPLPLLIILLFIWLGISTVTSPMPWVGLKTLLNNVALAGIFWSACRNADSRLARAAGLALTLASMVNGIWALLQFTGNDPYFVTRTGAAIIGIRDQIGAFTGNPNYLAPLFVFGCIFAFAELTMARQLSQKIVWYLFLGFFILAIIITQTFAALASLLAVIAAASLGIFVRRGVKLWILTAFASGLVLAALGAAFWLFFFDQGKDHRQAVHAEALRSGKLDYFLTGRYYAWLVTWEMISDHPFKGHGTGMFPVADSKYESGYPQLDYHEFVKQEGVFNETHNDYLQFWAENGLIALLLLLAAVGAISVKVLRFLFAPDGSAALSDRIEREGGPQDRSREDRIILAMWALIGLAVAVNALGSFPMHLHHLALSAVVGAGICARLSNAWVPSSDSQIIRGAKRRAFRSAIAILLAGALVVCGWWVFRPYRAARLRLQFKPGLQEVSALRNSLQWQKASTKNLSLQLIELARELVRIDPWTAENQVALALACFHAHQFSDAAEAYSQAVALRADPTVYANMGANYAEMGDVERAKQYYALALIQDPFHAQAQDSLRQLGRMAIGKEYPPVVTARFIPLGTRRP